MKIMQNKLSKPENLSHSCICGGGVNRTRSLRGFWSFDYCHPEHVSGFLCCKDIVILNLLLGCSQVTAVPCFAYMISSFGKSTPASARNPLQNLCVAKSVK